MWQHMFSMPVMLTVWRRELDWMHLEVVMGKSRCHCGIGPGWGPRKNAITYSWCPGLDLNLLPHKYKSRVLLLQLSAWAFVCWWNTSHLACSTVSKWYFNSVCKVVSRQLWTCNIFGALVYDDWTAPTCIWETWLCSCSWPCVYQSLIGCWLYDAGILNKAWGRQLVPLVM